MKGYYKSKEYHQKALEAILDELKFYPKRSLDLLRKKHKCSARIIKYITDNNLIINTGYHCSPNYKVNISKNQIKNIVKKAEYYE